MQTQTKFTGTRLVIFIVLALAYCYVCFHRVTMAIIGDLLAEEFSLDPAQLGFLGSILLYCYAFLQLPSGLFADNFGAKRTVMLSLVLSVIGSAVFAVAWNFGAAVFGRILIGLGISCIYLSIIKILSLWFDENEFGTVLGLLMALGALGSLLATTPLAVSVHYFGWRASYGLVAALTLGLIALVHNKVRNTPDSESKSREKLLEESNPEKKERTSKNMISFSRTTWLLMRDRTYMMLVIFMVAGSSLQGFQGLWAGPFLSRSYGFSLIEVGNTMLWYSIGGICGPPLWGLLSDNLVKSRKRVLIWGSAVSMILWFFPSFMPAALPPETISPFFFLLAMASGGGVLTHAMVRESFSYEILGIGVGIINFFTFLGGAAFTQLMGNFITLFEKVDGQYPRIAYQTTMMLIFFMWVVRLVSLAFIDERRQMTSRAAVREVPEIAS